MSARALCLAALAVTACSATAPATSLPPAVLRWPAPADTGAAIAAAQFDDGPVLQPGAVAWLLHLDVYQDGTPIIVPANLGVDFKTGTTAPVHTHLANGVFNVETTQRRRYTLGQVFTLWAVPLAGATAYANGVAAPDAASVELADKQELAVVFGTPPGQIPSTLPAWIGVFSP